MEKEVSTQAKKLAQHTKRQAKILEFSQLTNFSKKLKKQKKKIVFATGTFDLLNPGQCRYLAEAKSLGDVLVLGVSTDNYELKRRGENYPLTPEQTRVELVSFLKTVDYVITVDDDRAHGVLALLRPDVYFTSERSWTEGRRDNQELYILELYKGKVVKRPVYKPYIGTTALVEHIANIRVLQILEKYLGNHIPGFKLNPDDYFSPADYGHQIPDYKGAFNSNDCILDFADLEKFGEQMRKKGKTVCFVSGSYDLLHVGHARFIEKAGLLADILVVGIPSDKSLRQLKGIGRPVVSQHSRAYVLGHLEPVNKVVIFDEPNVQETLRRLKPDVFFTVAEAWNKGYKSSPEYKIIKSYGGRVETAPRQSPSVSASGLIDRVATNKVNEIFMECMQNGK